MKYALLTTALITATSVGCNDATKPATNTAPATSTASATDSNTGSGTSDTSAAKRDNSGVNVRDRADAAKTPFDQNENKNDINITANIRKRVVDTKMSVNAQNVKIITQDGKVTLRGPVKSDDEKMQVDKIAQDVAGPANVTNQLEVQP